MSAILSRYRHIKYYNVFLFEAEITFKKYKFRTGSPQLSTVCPIMDKLSLEFCLTQMDLWCEISATS